MLWLRRTRAVRRWPLCRAKRRRRAVIEVAGATWGRLASGIGLLGHCSCGRGSLVPASATAPDQVLNPHTTWHSLTCIPHLDSEFLAWSDPAAAG